MLFLQAVSIAIAGWSFISPVQADWQFKSRPDLSPPKLNITIPATSSISPGYLFIAPFSGYPEGTRHGPLQAAPYIFTSDGELVWSGFTYFSIWATNFQAARYKGEPILFSFEGSHNAAYGHGHGHTTFLNQNYETVRELRAGNHRLTDKHEFHIVNEETALIQIYHPVPWDLEAYGASEEQQWIVDARFQELDIETGKVLFEWSSLDHVDPEEAYLPLNPGQAGSGYNSSDAWDYFHINSVDKDAEGSYLLSARDTNTLYKINGTTGSIIWRLGGKHSNFTLGSGVEFSFQHHARWLSVSASGTRETISLYDNSAHGTENGRGKEVHLAPFSRGLIVTVDTETWEAKLVQAFHPPDKLLSKSQGSTHVLPNDNVLVNWGSSGAVTEFLPNGTAIFHAYLDSDALGVGVENYRAFRYNWTGLPNEEPAIVALKDANGKGSTVYVSWNGDTETKKWAFYGGRGEKAKVGRLQFLGEKKRTGFETAFKVEEEGVQRVQAVALGRDGSVLRSTGVVEEELEVLRYKGSGKRKGGEGEKACGHGGGWTREVWGFLKKQELRK